MSDKRCDDCGKPLHEADEVIATVLTTFHDIPSKRSYAINMPTECFHITHRDCDSGGSDEETN